MRSTALPFLARLLLLAAAGLGLARGSPASCALRTPLSAGLLRFEASDGQELLSATWAPRRTGLNCRVTVEPREVASFLSRCRLAQRLPEGPPLPDLAEAKAACESIEPSSSNSSPPRRAKRGFTYPGTLWCGAGNIAESYDQLGAHRETDKCCREHDHCHHVIHPFTYKYGYRNFRWHTISHCDCDNRLKACLQAVNDAASRVVGQAFFNIIQVPCFEFTYMEQCVEPYLYVWCKNYSTVAVAVTQDPVLYEYGGEPIDGPIVHELPARPSSPTAEPDSPNQPMAPSGAPVKKPGLAVPGKKHRKGKGKGKDKKEKKGKGLKKKDKKKGKGLKKNKKAGRKVGGAALQYPSKEEATLSPKHLDAQELGKVDLQAPAGLPDLREEDPFNAILGDDPASLHFGETTAQTESKTPVLQKEEATPSPAQPFRRKRKRKGRRRTAQQPELAKTS
ncbi:hypothetical protein lerEdw1_002651 [Lerista edwardsae]|nr:hypothetical protein lerEdw1_002651 [Lerista edwardsae]